MSATESTGDEAPEGLTIAEAIDRAHTLHRGGAVESAQEIYERVLEAVPEHPDALNFYGILKFQQGHRREGADLLRRCVESAPHYHDAHTNLGLMLRSLGDLTGAESHLAIAAQLKPGATAARLGQAMLLKSQGRKADAIVLLEEMIVDTPHDDLVRKALVDLLQTTGRIEEARKHYHAGEGMGGMEGMRIGLAYAEAKKGNLATAREQMERWIALDPENPKPRHLLAAYGGAPVPERASDAMVRKTFDSFAPSFDRQLEVLQYRAPELVEKAIEVATAGWTRPVDLLDAGCGTGLLAPRVRQRVRRLDGVDLSGGMLEKARALNLYDELVEGELTAYLLAHPQDYDVIACADTLCYFGAIDAALDAAHDALRPGGVFVFSVEHQPDLQTDYLLQVHGRYSHRQSYVERALQHSAFVEVKVEPCTLRMEMLVPVAGLIVTAKRRSD